jgi:hypothetical protein
MKRKIILATLLLCLVAVAFSSPSFAALVTFKTNWQRPGYTGLEYKKIAVVAISKRPAIRRIFEAKVVNSLEKKGCQAIQSLDFLPPITEQTKEGPDREVLRQKFEALDVDGVITMRLAFMETKSRYMASPVPSQDPIATQYPDFFVYYPSMYSNMYSPGYYKEREVAFIETNFYEVDQAGLLWTGMAKVSDPTKVLKASSVLAKDVVKELFGKKIILPCKAK